MNNRPVITQELPPIMTRQELAQLLRCSTRTVFESKIPCVKIGRLVRYRREDVQTALQAMEAGK